MSGCAQCSGNCAGCSGCGSCLELNTGEIAMLRKLGQLPFLPVARKTDDPAPIYLEDSDYSPDEYSIILQCLEKKGLITIDFDAPLKGFSGEAYAPYPIKGSFAMTARGQQVLDLLDIQGIQE